MLRNLVLLIVLMGVSACSANELEYPCHVRLADTLSQDEMDATIDAATLWNALAERHGIGEVIIVDGTYHHTSDRNALRDDTINIFPTLRGSWSYTQAQKYSTSPGKFVGTTFFSANPWDHRVDIILASQEIAELAEKNDETAFAIALRVMLHEFGHVLGLQHFGAPGGLMYGSRMSFKTRPMEITKDVEEVFCYRMGCTDTKY